MADDRTMAGQWEDMRRLLLADAHPVQVQEMRRAFYAGGQALLGLIMSNLDPGEEPTDADLARMDQLEAELMQFGRDVAEGRA